MVAVLVLPQVFIDGSGLAQGVPDGGDRLVGQGQLLPAPENSRWMRAARWASFLTKWAR